MTKQPTSPRTGSQVLDRQAPLRELYAQEPARAVTPKRAMTEDVPGDPYHGRALFDSGYGVAPFEFGVDRNIGGLHDAPNPPELLCAAIAACEHATIRSVADALSVEIDRLRVDVSGDVDVRGAMAMDREVPVGFLGLRVKIECDAPDADPRRLEMVLRQAERLCITLQTVRNGAPVELVVQSPRTTA
jgi:uncharacterized OsmC-like protein